MRKIIIVLLVLLAPITAQAYRSQHRVTSASNVTDGGGALTVLNVSGVYSTDGSTWALKSDAQIAGSTVPVYSTGTIVVQNWKQIAIEWANTVRNAATAVNMSCQTRTAESAVWFPVLTVTQEGTSTARAWSHAVSAASAGKWNFEINAWGLRCLFWGTSANGTDRITVGMRVSDSLS